VSELQAQFAVTPFTRLARLHAFSTAGDAFVAVALAGSLFFSISPGEARWRTALYLVLTMAPFAVVGPFIGPMLDRIAGGRRMVALLMALTRLISAILMVGNIKSLVLFPLAFVQLVSSKGYAVTKSALVPTTVATATELVEANAKLALLSGVMGFVAFIPAAPLIALKQPGLVMVLASMAFAGAVAAAWMLPRATVSTAPPTRAERLELRSAGVVLAASAMAVLRGIVGFLTFAVAFWFRRIGAATAWFGLVLAFATIGGLTGSAVAPIVRRRAREETMLWGSLAGLAVIAGAAAVSGGKVSAAVLGAAVGFAGGVGRLAFDSIVQRDAPDANRGRSFAAFETRFQIVWVAGAFIPVAIPLTGWLFFTCIAGAAGFAAVSYVLSSRHVAEHGALPTPLRVRARITWETLAENQRRRNQAGPDLGNGNGETADEPPGDDLREMPRPNAGPAAPMPPPGPRSTDRLPPPRPRPKPTDETPPLPFDS
jgi:hypothetical protein